VVGFSEDDLLRNVRPADGQPAFVVFAVGHQSLKEGLKVGKPLLEIIPYQVVPVANPICATCCCRT
jgi:hypothetical protein